MAAKMTFYESLLISMSHEDWVAYASPKSSFSRQKTLGSFICTPLTNYDSPTPIHIQLAVHWRTQVVIFVTVTVVTTLGFSESSTPIDPCNCAHDHVAQIIVWPVCVPSLVWAVKGEDQPTRVIKASRPTNCGSFGSNYNPKNPASNGSKKSLNEHPGSRRTKRQYEATYLDNFGQFRNLNTPVLAHNLMGLTEKLIFRCRQWTREIWTVHGEIPSAGVTDLVGSRGKKALQHFEPHQNMSVNQCTHLQRFSAQNMESIHSKTKLEYPLPDVHGFFSRNPSPISPKSVRPSSIWKKGFLKESKRYLTMSRSAEISRLVEVSRTSPLFRQNEGSHP